MRIDELRKPAGLLGAWFLTLIITLYPLALTAAALRGYTDRTLHINREWDILPGIEVNSKRTLLSRAGTLLGPWRIELAGVEINGESLVKMASTEPDSDVLRVVREHLRRPVDLKDFLLFLDDILLAGEHGLRGKQVFVPSGRARTAGILVHPQDVFTKNQPRNYGDRRRVLNIDLPKQPADLTPAADGTPLGSDWSARFLNPETEGEMMATLEKTSPSSSFTSRLSHLFDQLRQQGAEVDVQSTVRLPERGYLMWGAFALSRLDTSASVRQWTRKLDHYNKQWNLNIPIRWLHPAGWEATIKAAREMADAYNVVYATQRGARYSDHYDGIAIDFSAVGLPAMLELVSADGNTRQRFDLSQTYETRDLNLTPALINWVEEYFYLKKLRMDYPHWRDAEITE